LLLAVLGLAGKAGERVLKRGLNRLYRLGLLAESQRGVVIHPLLAEFARLQDKAVEESALPGLADGLAGAASAARQRGVVANMLPLLPHLRQVLGYAAWLEREKVALLASWLGKLYQDTGDHPAARPYLEQALAIRGEVLGEKHLATASSLNNLGDLLHSMGDYAGAQPYYEQALAICREVLGEKHPNTAASLNNLGALLDSMGDYAGAQPYYEQALAIFREVLGEKHPNTASSLNNLGSVLRAQGDYAGAQPYYEQALAILETSLPPDHSTLRTVRANLESVISEIQKRRSGS
jgi:tetratricopeptide (TPR) repeat protein